MLDRAKDVPLEFFQIVLGQFIRTERLGTATIIVKLIVILAAITPLLRLTLLLFQLV